MVEKLCSKSDALFSFLWPFDGEAGSELTTFAWPPFEVEFGCSGGWKVFLDSAGL
jgi:hypothetical protein